MRGVKIYESFWRESAREPRLFIFSAWVCIPLLMFLLHITWFTFGLLVLTIVIIKIIERYGFTVGVAILALRCVVAGKVIKRRRSMFAKTLDR